MSSALADDIMTPGFLKAGFLGFPKSGKTFTAALLAMVVREYFKLTGPIAHYDTEGGSVYIKTVVEKTTGQKFLAKRARSFDSMMEWGKACLEAKVSVAFVDSITHPWRELCDSYLEQKNNDRRQRNWSVQDRLQFEDWNVLKPRWARWTDFYLNSPLHLIICGRAGWDYEMEVNEKGKKEIVKGGIKMKTESEFGFEPSLLVELERIEVPNKEGGMHYTRKATVLGDRFSLIDGAAAFFHSVDASDPKQVRKAMDAVKKFFGPHIEALASVGPSDIDTSSQSAFKFEGGEDAWAAEKKRRTILCEEIQGVLVKAWPGQTAAEKAAKLDAIEEFLGTRSWTAVENTDSGKLKDALGKLREKLKQDAAVLVPLGETSA